MSISAKISFPWLTKEKNLWVPERNLSNSVPESGDLANYSILSQEGQDPLAGKKSQ